MKKNKMKNNRKNNALRCPYCGGSVVYKSADGIYKENASGAMLLVCSHYPECDAYARVLPDIQKHRWALWPDGKLRALRIAAHKQFDKLHKGKFMTRKEAYVWLANLISAPLSQAHIGYLGEYYCNLVIRESKKLLQAKQAINKYKEKEM